MGDFFSVYTVSTVSSAFTVYTVVHYCSAWLFGSTTTNGIFIKNLNLLSGFVKKNNRFLFLPKSDRSVNRCELLGWQKVRNRTTYCTPQVKGALCCPKVENLRSSQRPNKKAKPWFPPPSTIFNVSNLVCCLTCKNLVCCLTCNHPYIHILSWVFTKSFFSVTASSGVSIISNIWVFFIKAHIEVFNFL